MPSFSSVDWTEDGLGNPLKMHAHDELINGVLKDDLGFDGFVISDWRAIHQIPGDYATQVATSVNAGVDMFMEPFSGDTVGYPQFIETLTQLVDDGVVPMSRIDDAVSRILTAKFELGLFEHPFTDRKHLDDVGSASHRRVAREAVAKSQVLLRNRHHTLPLSSRAKVYVSGSNADNLGNQAGGWTLTWQGGSTNVFPGDTILDGIEAATRGPVVFSEDATAPVPRVHTASSWWARRRTPKASATSAARGGPGTRATAAYPGHRRRCSCRTPTRRRSRPCARRRRAALCSWCRAGRWRSRRTCSRRSTPGRVVAARQRGQRGRRRALRPPAVHGVTSGDLAPHGRPGADQRRRRRLRPAVPLRLGPAGRSPPPLKPATDGGLRVVAGFRSATD